MSEKNDATQVLEILMNTYVELVKIQAAPGDKAFNVSMSKQFCERLIKRIMEYKFGKPK